MAKNGEAGCCCGTDKAHALDWSEALGKWVPQTTRRKAVTTRGAQRSVPSASMMSAMPARNNRAAPLPFATANGRPMSLAPRAAAAGSAALIWDDRTRLWVPVPDRRSGRLGDMSVPMRARDQPGRVTRVSPCEGDDLLEDNFDSYDEGPWDPGSLVGPRQWQVRFGEHDIRAIPGEVGSRALHQEPLCANGLPGDLACVDPDDPDTLDCCRTTASLVVSTGSFCDFELTVRMRTERQLRIQDPDDPRYWEVAWLVWHTDPTFDNGMYFLIDETGWELGRSNDRGGEEQTFMASGARGVRGKEELDLKLEYGLTYTVRVRQIGESISVWVDDGKGEMVPRGTAWDGIFADPFENVIAVDLENFVFTGVNVPWPYPEFEMGPRLFVPRRYPVLESGRIGLYSEDAEVYWDDLFVTAL